MGANGERAADKSANSDSDSDSDSDSGPVKGPGRGLVVRLGVGASFVPWCQLFSAMDPEKKAGNVKKFGGVLSRVDLLPTLKVRGSLPVSLDVTGCVSALCTLPACVHYQRNAGHAVKHL